MDIRDAREADVPDMQAIYAHHVLHGTGTFEEEPPPVEEMAARFHKVVDRGYVWLVAADATGVLGFGYYAPFRERSAYRFTVEDSIYVREDVRGQGVGKALVARLIELATAAGSAADDRGDRRLGECRLDRRACQPGVPYGWHDEIDRHQVRPVAGRGDDAAPAGQGRREPAGLMGAPSGMPLSDAH